MTTHLNRPQRQHTVSKVVLRRFRRGENLSVYDRRSNSINHKGPGGVFFSDFDQFDWVTAEQRWGAVESRMPAAYKLLDERRALEDPAAVETLRDLLAMHWVRSPAMQVAHERIGREVLARHQREMSGRPAFLSALLKQATGLVAGGPADLDWINATMHERVFAEHTTEMFSETVADYFERVRSDFARADLQVGYVDADADTDLVIGDAPVITLRPGHDGVGPHQGVAVREATSIVMPISPNIVIGLGPEPAQVTLNVGAVRTFNWFQWRGFVRWVGCRPGGPSDREMHQTWAARGQQA